VAGLQAKPEIQESPESRASRRIKLLRTSMRRRTLKQCSQKQAHEDSLRGLFSMSGWLACKPSQRFRKVLNQGLGGLNNSSVSRVAVQIEVKIPKFPSVKYAFPSLKKTKIIEHRLCWTSFDSYIKNNFQKLFFFTK